MRKSAALLGAGALAVAGAAFATPAAAQDANATVYVLHGVPGATVDVCVNGEVLLDDFTPGTLTPAQSLPAGSYEVKVVASDAANCDADALIGPASIPVEAGKSYTIAAFLDKDGGLTAKAFENDTEAAGAGEGKVTVRHIAANAEGVEVVASGSSLGTFNNGDQIGPAALPAGTINAEVKSGDTVVASSDVPVTEGTNTIVYAWGDPAADPSTFAFAVQTVDLGHSAPSGVPGGESGAAAAGTTGWLLAAAGLGLAGAAYSGRRLATTRR